MSQALPSSGDDPPSVEFSYHILDLTLNAPSSILIYDTMSSRKENNGAYPDGDVGQGRPFSYAGRLGGLVGLL